jgi:hypothetical protein
VPPLAPTSPPPQSLAAPTGWEEGAGWPHFPATDDEAQRLIERRTRRTIEGPESVTAELILAKLDGTARRGTAVATERGIAAWLADHFDEPKDVYIVFGVWHDSALQLATIRQLLGPVYHTAPITLVTELFSGDGRWAGVPSNELQGDDAWLGRYLAEGDRDAFATLVERQRVHDYTAWKYGTIGSILDLALQARATRAPLLGCDAPPEMAERLARLGDESSMRARELHCALRLEEAELPTPRRVALIWGQAHAEPDGLRRFFPPDARVIAVHVFGGRVSDHGVESELAARLRVTDPVLVPIGREDYALLIPGPRLGGRRDRRREIARAPEGGGRTVEPPAPTVPVRVTVNVAGWLRFRDTRRWLGAGATTTFAVEPGAPVFLFERPDRTIAFGVHLPPGSRAEIDLEEELVSTLIEVPSGDAHSAE